MEPSTSVTTTSRTPPQLPPRTPPRPNATRTPSPPLTDIPETTVQEATPLKKVTPEITEQPKPNSPLRKSIEIEDDEKKVELEKEPKENLVFEKDTQKKTEDKEERPEEIELDSDDEEEEIVIHEVHQAAAPQVINRARIVQVAKPVAPMLPPRNPFRNSRNRNSATSEASTERGAEEKPSPISTPSLRHGDSTSSLSSVDGEGLTHASAGLQPKSIEVEQESTKKAEEEKHDTLHSLPESLVKTVPGAF